MVSSTSKIYYFLIGCVLSKNLPPEFQDKMAGSDTLDIGAEVSQAEVDLLVPQVDLLDVVNDTCAFSRKSGNEQSHTGTDVG